MDKIVHCSTIHNSSKLDIVQRPMQSRMENTIYNENELCYMQ